MYFVFQLLGQHQFNACDISSSAWRQVTTYPDLHRPDFVKNWNSQCDNGVRIKTNTLPGKPYGVVSFEDFSATDDSLQAVVVQSYPSGYQLGRKYHFNYTKGSYGKVVSFKASDAAGNSRACRFEVIVADVEKPTIVKCPENIVVNTDKAQVRVRWNEPIFSDNCGSYLDCAVRVQGNILSGSWFAMGQTVQVMYRAVDPSGNVQDGCTFTVKIQAIPCPPVRPPVNGLVVKSKQLALPQCKKGFYPTTNFAFIYGCTRGIWNSLGGAGAYPFPDCTLKTPPSGLNHLFHLFHIFDGDCNSAATKAQAKSKLQSIGVPTDVNSMQIYCGSTTK